ncbi:MATE family efflux transporter [Acidaminobacter sp. JC074]|uniref:MATE family efflux transporter n=1 Tax=Acidaminobacter sp. JC074 TaxID=2530199 RepID=UPI001F108ED3|nr:MATE family efflux transporter [Acidaminobacter sp. JC074]MCH4886092.1 MATE family efflux transporter [Acidaminobacter sp. JC074]
MARRDLTQGHITEHFVSLTIPMILGILGLVAFNLADTYFVGKLGTTQMAALTFTFPVVLLLNSLNLGLGIGASAIISKAFGQKDHQAVKELSSYSILLGFTFALIASFIGLITIKPVFSLLGADQSVFPYIKDYMSIWYLGVPFVVIPMIGNSIIRALGDTKVPSMVMMLAAVTNIILDPIFIFGLGPVPAFGVKGAAIATVLSRSITFSTALYILIHREKVVSFKIIKIKSIIPIWKKILYIALPNAASRMILPIGLGIITGLISTYGLDAIAGYGIATRVEYFALAISQALASVIPVFVGQNFGAGDFDRIKEGIRISRKFMLSFNAGLYLILFIAGPWLIGLFTVNTQVIKIAVLYLRIVPLAYGFQGIILVLNGALNALHKPVVAASLNLIQMLVIYVPMAVILNRYFGVTAIFASLAFSYLVVAIMGNKAFKKILVD